VSALTVRAITPTTARNPKSKSAGIRLTMREPKPTIVVSAEMRNGVETSSIVRRTTSRGSLLSPPARSSAPSWIT
jgi:hypothetical protein